MRHSKFNTSPTRQHPSVHQKVKMGILDIICFRSPAHMYVHRPSAGRNSSFVLCHSSLHWEITAIEGLQPSHLAIGVVDGLASHREKKRNMPLQSMKKPPESATVRLVRIGTILIEARW